MKINGPLLELRRQATGGDLINSDAIRMNAWRIKSCKPRFVVARDLKGSKAEEEVNPGGVEEKEEEWIYP